MSLRKRIFSFVLAVVLICPLLCIPASARGIGVDWEGPFARFTEVCVGSPAAGYNKAAQRFLYCFPSTFRLIADNGGIDGIFGSKSKEAAIIYQKYEWPNEVDKAMWDGRIGGKTWSKIAGRLDPKDLYTNYDYILTYGNDYVYYLDTRAEGCTYYSYNVTSSGGVYKESTWFAQK